MNYGPGANPPQPPDLVTVLAAKHRPYLGWMRGGVIVRRRFCGCARCLLRYLGR